MQLRTLWIGKINICEDLDLKKVSASANMQFRCSLSYGGQRELTIWKLGDFPVALCHTLKVVRLNKYGALDCPLNYASHPESYISGRNMRVGHEGFQSQVTTNLK